MPRMRLAWLATAGLLAAATAAAQQRPAVRPLGPVILVSAPNLVGSVSAVRPLPHGRLLVNDVTRRQVVLLDSALQTSRVVVDSSAAAGGMFGLQLAGIIPFAGDSTLFVDPQTLTILVLDGDGMTRRVMAIPRPQDAGAMVGGPFGTPMIDAAGRLVYRAIPRPVRGSPPSPGRPIALPDRPDSAPIIRLALDTRRADTAAWVRVFKTVMTLTMTREGAPTVTATINPVQMLDDWVAFADGTVAVVRGGDYHVDWVSPAGERTSTPRVPFAWQRLTDTMRTTLLDSAQHVLDAQVAAARAAASRQTTGPMMRLVGPAELPDYRPVFDPGAAHAAPDGRIWVRTSESSASGAVYDVIDRSGALVERVRVPPHRSIIAFGDDTLVYLGVLDAVGARVEVARVR